MHFHAPHLLNFAPLPRSLTRQLRAESKRMNDLREKLQKRISDMEKKKDAVDAERDNLKLQVDSSSCFSSLCTPYLIV